MANKPSDDPMDLGGFMKNFVLNNPFKDMPGIQGGKDMVEADEDVTIPTVMTTSDSNDSSTPSSLNIKNTAESNTVRDTPKAYVGSNIEYAAALKLQKVASAHAKAQKWLRSNFLYEPSWQVSRDAKELITLVQEKFPHVSNMTFSKIMTFTFPNCTKVRNISGFVGYKGLIPKPKQEDYANLDLLKAVSHSKLYGSINEAAQLYDVPLSSVASLHYWHPDITRIPVHASIAEQLQQVDPSILFQRDELEDSEDEVPRRSSRKRQSGVRYFEPDASDSDQESQFNKRPKCNSPTDPGILTYLKSDVPDSNDNLNAATLEDPSAHESPHSLLRHLLNRPTIVQVHGQNSVNIQSDVVVKSEPIDFAYGDASDGGTMEKQHLEIAKQSDKNPVNSEAELAHLRIEVQQLRKHVNSQALGNRKQQVELLLSQREVLKLKSKLCDQQAIITELSQDFTVVRDKFSRLERKFRHVLDLMEKGKLDNGLDFEQFNFPQDPFDGAS